jgi:uncharacterized protein (DUF1778 family)
VINIGGFFMRAHISMPERVRIRLFAEEKSLIEQAARAKGMSISDFVRTAATGAAQQVAA